LGYEGGKDQKRRIQMTEDEKKEVALFRYGVISELVNARGLSRGEQEQLIRERCDRK
jgi:hypothetical protein